ncbi:hypothetical protein T492DRAFT_1072875 [Pavlovales sp. CCMP2436]|nr:hypothetical protein T492DRAFT_1072875 [Pavlovales sp. CCMP2436]|mmetsp:Transcript_1523/g.4039  ORF Transcript_1523/g.4039 Transcript_1523/m.4039 type:complete len:240 (-) Transcript_1523:148-867(-)
MRFASRDSSAPRLAQLVPMGSRLLAGSAAAGSLALGWWWYRVTRAGVHEVAIPPDSALGQQVAASLGGSGGCASDAFACIVPLPRGVQLAALNERYMRAFFTSPLFRAERAILAAAGYPSTDAEIAVMRFDRPGTDRVAIFDLTSRSASSGLDEALYSWSPSGRTWFGVRDGPNAHSAELLCGSAILDVPAAPFSNAPLGEQLKGALAYSFWPLHRAYGQLLLAEARLRLPTGNSPPES